MNKLKIDFVSDVACPWCAVGLGALERALETLDGEVQAELHFQPFELNPQMAREGEDIDEHLSKKYGRSPAEFESARKAIRERGAAVGFTFGQRSRIYNTFDAHRLLHFAGLQSAELQHQLKAALLKAYHGEGRDPSDPAVLAAVAAEVGPGQRTHGADPGQRRVRRRSACDRAALAAPGHQLGALGGDQRPPPDPGRPAARGVRAGFARNRCSRLTRLHQAAEQAAQVAQPAGRRLAVRGELVDHLRQHLRQLTGGIALAQAQLPGDLPDGVVAQHVVQLVGADRQVLPAADPR